MTTRGSTARRKIVFFLAIFFLVGFPAFLLLKSLLSSLFLNPIERINFVVYGEKPLYYSLDTKHDVDYLVSFYPDLKIAVPGGYGQYRFGALGKLIRLYRDPDILRRSFSGATSTFTPFYFYSSGGDVTYGSSEESNTSVPGIREIFFYHSNASIFDKLYLYLALAGSKRAQFTLINQFKTDVVQGDRALMASAFFKKYQGFFYQSSYRSEKRTVQLMYTNSYKTADTLSRVIEGNGIRVVDLSQTTHEGKCEVVENTSRFSRTAQDLARFFDCSLVAGNTTISDIIVKLGEVEEKWKIR